MPVVRYIEPGQQTETGSVTLTASELAAAIDCELPTARRLLAVVTETVLEYAPMAPVSLLNEACIRMAGFLNAAAGRLRAYPRRPGRGIVRCIQHATEKRVVSFGRGGPAYTSKA